MQERKNEREQIEGRLIVDRLEEGYAVCEQEDRSMIRIRRTGFPPGSGRRRACRAGRPLPGGSGRLAEAERRDREQTPPAFREIGLRQAPPPRSPAS